MWLVAFARWGSWSRLHGQPKCIRPQHIIYWSEQHSESKNQVIECICIYTVFNTINRQIPIKCFVQIPINIEYVHFGELTIVHTKRVKYSFLCFRHEFIVGSILVGSVGMCFKGRHNTNLILSLFFQQICTQRKLWGASMWDP